MATDRSYTTATARLDLLSAEIYHGKNHKQAMGAMMSHIGAGVLTVLQEEPCELRDIEGRSITWNEAKKLILANYQVPEKPKQYLLVFFSLKFPIVLRSVYMICAVYS